MSIFVEREDEDGVAYLLSEAEIEQVRHAEFGFVTHRGVTHRRYYITIVASEMLECIQNFHQFVDEFRGAAISDASGVGEFNVRFRVDEQGLVSAFCDEKWGDLIGSEAMVFTDFLDGPVGSMLCDSWEAAATKALMHSWAKLSYFAFVCEEAVERGCEIDRDEIGDHDLPAGRVFH